MNPLRQLFRHMEWADATVWRAVLALPAAATDKRVHDLLTHLHATQRAFFSVWSGSEVDFADFKVARDMESLCRWAREYHADLVTFLLAFDESVLPNELRLPWAESFEKQIGVAAHPSTWEETMFQLPAHSTYHRAQVNARLRELGGEPPLVDFIAWIWSGKPEASWPVA